MTKEDQVLAQIEERLRPLFGIKDVLLFGSRARGEATEGSDYDVLVIADSDVPFIERQGAALLALGRRDYALDLLVYTPAEIEREQRMLGSAVYWALREGRSLHAA